MSYNPIETGKRIRFCREKIGFSRAEFAEALNISRSHLQKLEIGAKGPSIDLLVDISTLCGVSTDFLLMGKEDKHSSQLKMALGNIVSELNNMRDRKIQRALRRDGITKEQPLSRRDFCGIRDPTPYSAVKNIIDQEKDVSRQRTHEKNPHQS